MVRRPRVRLAVTGNELLPSGSRPHGFHIADANGPMLAALIERDGGVVDFPGLVRDDRNAILEALHADADIVIVSGGSSVGIEDLAPMLVAQHGELAVHGIAMRPSSPTGLGRIGHRLVFLLPGNPVSSLCAYDFFAGRAIRALGGRSKEWPYRAIRGKLNRKISSPIGRLDYARVKIDGRAGRAARRRRRVAAVVDDARGRLRDRGRRQRGLRGRRRGQGLAVCAEQEQFLQVLDRDEAERRFRAAIDCTPRGIEIVPLDAALGRVLAADVVSPVDVPSFDRSNVDGFAVVAEDTFGASEEVPRIGAAGRGRDSHRHRPDHGDSSRQGGVDRHRRHGSARRRRGRDGRARRGTRRRTSNRQGRHSGQRHIVCRNRHHRGRDGASPRPAADQPRHGSARRDRCRECQRLAKADRRDPFDRRRDHRARRSDAARQGLRLQRAGARRRRAGTGRRAQAAGHHA